MLSVIALLALAASPQDWPIEVGVPPGWEKAKAINLLQVKGDPIPGQIQGNMVHFLVKNEKAVLTLNQIDAVAGPARAECVDDGKHLTIKVDGKNVLRYNYATIEQPDPVFSRSGYIHPIWTPAGKVLTNDSPPNHLHHHGLWSAWTSAEFEGRKSNFWESKEKQGRVECVKVEQTWSGPVFAGFKARHRYVNLNGPAGEKVALEELWEVRVYALSDRFVFDLLSTQTCATDQPLVIKEYRYGGIGFRGSADWEGKAGVAFLTSEGKTRVDGHATKAKWCAATGKIGGAEASIGFLCHPKDFRFPQPLRLHPDEPFFNWAVPQGGDFSIEPGKPYTARYRFIVSGEPTLAPEVLWRLYTGPSAELAVGK